MTSREMYDLQDQAKTWRAAVEHTNDERARLNELILRAKRAGCSFASIREATGLGIATIQMVLAKAGE